MKPSLVPPEPESSGGNATDTMLLQRCATGDEEAFAVFYDRFAPRVYGLIARVVRNPAISEEVTQDALVEVWRSSARFDPERGSAAGWTLSIAHRRAIDRVRSEEASSRRDTTYSTTTTMVDHDQTTERVERSLQGERVRAALDSLSHDQRRSIELAYYGGYTHTEVAALLDIPLGTAKTRIRDGMIRLRDALRGDQ